MNSAVTAAATLTCGREPPPAAAFSAPHHAITFVESGSRPIPALDHDQFFDYIRARSDTDSEGQRTHLRTLVIALRDGPRDSHAAQLSSCPSPSACAGSKGPRLYDWAWLTDGDPTGPHDGWHSLLIRRNYTTGELAFYRCWTPEPAGLARLVHVAGTRWIVEVGFQTAKGQVGLDQHQVRRWHSWHRFTTLALAALAILAICAADTNQDHTQPDTPRLSINEIRRLINILLSHPTGDTTHHLRWSNWRLHHQARARRAHYARRLNLEFPP